MQFDITKQIDFVGLRRTGATSYECRYPVLLIAWLRKQGFKEKPIEIGELARLTTSEAEVRVRKTGRIRVYGDAAPHVHDTLQNLVK
jgi:hypothetical protein